MKREINIEEISDGKLYGINDMVKADCQECKGCFSCCCGMGASIVLDPLDVLRLKNCTGLSFEGLMKENIELNVVDHVILPNLKMNIQDEKCNFLDGAGRCSIHANRPGICRIFPLGRIYEDRSFRYFLQVKECEKTNRSKIKVSKWIDTTRVRDNQKYICEWHYFLKDVEEMIMEGDADAMRQVSMYVLNSFYVRPIEVEAFYEEIAHRMLEAREALGL